MRAVPFCLIATAFLLWGALAVLLSIEPLKSHIVEAIGVLLATSAVYLISVWRILQETRSRPGRLAWVLAASAVFRLTIWPLEPAFSDDLYRYRWEARLQLAGGNPYETSPVDPLWRSLRDETYARIPGKEFRAVYGPLTELVYRGAFFIIAQFTADPRRQIFWLKLPAALFDVAVVAGLCMLLKAAGRPMEHVLIYAWSPLPVFEFWGNGHNDPILLCALVAALVLAMHNRWTLSFAALGAAAAAKVWPAALIPLFMGWKAGRPERWSPSVALLAVLAILQAPFGWGLLGNLPFLSGFLGGWRNNDSLYGFFLWIWGDPYKAKYTAAAVLAACVAFLAVRGVRLSKAVLSATAALLLVSANCHPWYLTWILILLPLHPSLGLLLWTALVPTAYQVLPAWELLGQWQGSTPLRWWIYTPVLATLAWEMLRQTRRKIRAC